MENGNDIQTNQTVPATNDVQGAQTQQPQYTVEVDSYFKDDNEQVSTQPEKPVEQDEKPVEQAPKQEEQVSKAQEEEQIPRQREQSYEDYLRLLAQTRAVAEQLANQYSTDALALQAKLELEALKMENAIAKEEALWEKAFNEYPQIKENPQLDNMVYAYYKERRAIDPNYTPLEAAKDFMKSVDVIASKKAQNVEQELTQKMLGSVRTNGGQPHNSDIISRLESGDRSAIDDFFNSI